MKFHRRTATPFSKPLSEDNMELPQFELNAETQRIYRELKKELKQLKLENKINDQLNRMLSERLSKINQ